MDFRFAADVPMRWVDVDSWGVINNAVHLTLMEQGRYEYFRALGLLPGGQVPFVLAEATVRFRRPGRLGMGLQVAAKVTRLGRSSFGMAYEVRSVGGGKSTPETLSEGEATLVFVDEELQPRPLPDDFRGQVAEFEGLDADPTPS